ncbi:hypothetical protein PHYC_01609 [Phycisphaerales bacterium]|nr:hypothetical protein PHYC_01609 [Phycisphaerales bacterium]
MLQLRDRRIIVLGFAAGVCAASGVAMLMGQGQQPQPTRAMGGEYYVTGDENSVSLWVREGSSVQWVAEARRMDPRKPPNDGTPKGP